MMETIEALISELDNYVNELGISRKELADRLAIPYSTVKHWFQHGKGARKPSEANLTKIRTFLESKGRPEVYHQFEDTKRRAQRVKYLLLLLEDELRWFRDGSTDARDVFRKELDANDIGYISSLLIMLSDEEKFKRWLTLTTANFQSFRRR
jgi:hypothetical protein